LTRSSLLPCLLGALLGLGLAAGLAAQQTEEAAKPAYHIQEGSVARNRVVALGQDLWLDGEATSQVVVLNGQARIRGKIAGDLIVLGGDAELGEKAAIEGDLYVLGGSIAMAAGAQVEGRSVAYPQASDLWIALIEGPTLGTAADPKVVIGAKLALIAFWAFLTLLLFGVARRELLATSESIARQPFRNFFLGLTGVAAMVLTALFFSAFSGALLGVPLLVLVVVVALVLRFWGMVALFHALGTWLTRRFAGSRIPIQAATWGLLALGLVKLVPYLGLWTWSLATFIGVGAALETRLGRRDPWLE
jgi:cytoskeletal protein CcmA (bactofilin family)